MERDMISRLRNDFTYHQPVGNQPERYANIRMMAESLGLFLLQHCPESRELSLALTNLEQAVFWANASIARNEKQDG